MNRLRTFVCILLTATAALAAQQRARFTTEDLLTIRTFAGGQPIAVSPTGRWIAYVLTDVDDEWNVQEPRPTGYVYMQAPDSDSTAPPRALTSGSVHSSWPVWSPDGRRLAFIARSAAAAHHACSAMGSRRQDALRVDTRAVVSARTVLRSIGQKL